MPTSLVAQVDSAYGGKTGVDLPEGKNYVGAYHLPAAVIVDPSTLATLPREELAAGFVEVLKTGLLAGGALWERVRGIEALDPAGLDDVVFACARYKCEVVAADERDGGCATSSTSATRSATRSRRPAATPATGTARRSGSACWRRCGSPTRRSSPPRSRRSSARHGLPVTLDPAIDADAVIEAIGRDKKRTAEGVGFVLLSRRGEPREGQVLDPDRVRCAVEDLY